MTRTHEIRREFVDAIPEQLHHGVAYVSVRCATVVHRCCCACGAETVTALSPRDWSVTFGGESISLRRSIGNWSFPCQSHYWIQNNQIRWARRFDQDEIDKVRRANVDSMPARADTPPRRCRFAAFARLWRLRG